MSPMKLLPVPLLVEPLASAPPTYVAVGALSERIEPAVSTLRTARPAAF